MSPRRYEVTVLDRPIGFASEREDGQIDLELRVLPVGWNGQAVLRPLPTIERRHKADDDGVPVCGVQDSARGRRAVHDWAAVTCKRCVQVLAEREGQEALDTPGDAR